MPHCCCIFVQSMICFVVFAISEFGVLATPPLFQNSDVTSQRANDRQTDMQTVDNYFRDVVSSEVKRIQFHFRADPGFPKDWVHREASKKRIDRLVEVACKGLQPPGPITLKILRRFRLGVCSAVADELRPSQKDSLSKYRADLIRKWEEQDSIARNAFFVFIDDYLCLSDQQAIEFRELLRQTWDCENNKSLTIFSTEGFLRNNELSGYIEVEKLKELLNPDQLDLFNRFQ